MTESRDSAADRFRALALTRDMVTDDDQIGTFTVFARPVSAVLALGQALAPGQAKT
jgi:hypothetical protein